ncbi:hypothetical protein ACW5R3_10245 [Bizionia sp. KMM 8389]
MTKYLFYSCLLLAVFGAQAQERFLSISAKDSINGEPRFTTSIGANLKLNGYFDFFGGLQDSETFNVGKIHVFGTDDSHSLHMDLYQTQIVWASAFVLKDGRHVTSVVEGDFWGGNGQFRLRKAYVESEHWQIGQNWNNFADEDLWPNILEWEGPPSGVWLRSPHIKYTNHFKNPEWRYAFSLEAPISDYLRYPELEPLVEEANQVAPDFTAAISYRKAWGHIRLASIWRHITYKLDGEKSSFMGYGFSLSGKYQVVRNNFQFQFTGGQGISAYLTTVTGFGYDGFPTSSNGFKATPAFGGWTSYEYFFSDKWHSNLVVGYTNFKLDDLERFIVADNSELPVLQLTGTVNHVHYYGLLNVMYDAFSHMTVGLEVDYGVKVFESTGQVNNLVERIDKQRDALRVSFGFMFSI